MTETEASLPPPNPPSTPPSGEKRHVLSHCLGIALACALVTAIFLYSTSLNHPVPEAPNGPDIAALEQRVDDLEARLTALGEKTPAPPSPVIETDIIDAAIKRIEDRLGQVEAAGAQDRNKIEKTIAAFFAIRDLRDAAKDGRAFASELAALRAATTGDAALAAAAAKLDAFAGAPPPSWSALRGSLAEAQKKAPLAEGQDDSFWAKVKRVFQPLVSVRPLRDPRFADLEKALEAQDSAAALAASGNLPAAVRETLGDWQAALESRMALDAAVQELSAPFMLQQGSAP